MYEQTSNSLISIIIPVGPGISDFKNLKKSLTLNKNFRNTEFILIIDSPSQEYFEFVKTIVSEIQIPNCRCISVNFGNPGQTRNRGIQESSSTWIQFWDSDDIGTLSPIIESITNCDSDILIQQYKMVTTENKVVATSATTDVTSLVLNPGIWRIAIRRSLVSRSIFPPLSMAEDQVFIFRILAMNPRIEFIRAETYSYFVGNQMQLTSQSEKMQDLPQSMKLISMPDCRGENNIVYLQILFLEKILITSIKKANRVVITQSFRTFMKYFIHNISLEFLLQFSKASFWLVRNLVK
jgi:hypothetical protein